MGVQIHVRIVGDIDMSSDSTEDNLTATQKDNLTGILRNYKELNYVSIERGGHEYLLNPANILWISVRTWES